jgi:hypothetical protein
MRSTAAGHFCVVLFKNTCGMLRNSLTHDEYTNLVQAPPHHRAKHNYWYRSNIAEHLPA